MISALSTLSGSPQLSRLFDLHGVIHDAESKLATDKRHQGQ